MSNSKLKEISNNELVIRREKFKNLLTDFEKKKLQLIKNESIKNGNNIGLLEDFFVSILISKSKEIMINNKSNWNDKKSRNFNLLDDLEQFYPFNYKKSDKNIINIILKEIYLLIEDLSPNLALRVIIDLLSLVNEHLTLKKGVGGFFTPELLTDYLVNQSLFYYFDRDHFNLNEINYLLKELEILDPAVGSGNFIVGVINSLFDLIFNSLNNYEYNSKIKTFLDDFINFIDKRLFGYDIESVSIRITKVRIILTVLNLINTNKEFKIDFDNSSAIKLNNIMEKDILSENSKKNEKFSIIIGNPPWGLSLKHSKVQLKKNFTVSKSQFDSWSLFLEFGINNLKKNGIISFIVPSTILVNPNYTDIRQLILNNTFVKEIVNLGEFFFPRINQPAVLIILKKFDKTTDEIEITTKFIPKINFNNNYNIHVKDNNFWNNQISFNELLIPYWKNNNLFEFNILSGELKEFVQNIESRELKIKDIMTNGRGVEIGKKGRIIICPKCKNAQPPLHPKMKLKKCPNCLNTLDKTIAEKKIIFKNEKDVAHNIKYKKLFLGEHIQRFYSKNPAYIRVDAAGINYKKEKMYSGPKLLLAKTGHGINAYIDENDTYTLQVVYIFKIRNEISKNLSEWSILGILNSAIIHTYYYAKYGDINRKTYPHLIQSTILNLPIPKLTKENENILENIAKISEDLQKKYGLLSEINNIRDIFHESLKEKTEISLLSLLTDHAFDAETINAFVNFLDENRNIHSNIDFDLDKNQFLVIGHYFENKFLELNRIQINSQNYLLLIYMLLKNQKNKFTRNNKSIYIILNEKIKVSNFDRKTKSIYEKKLAETLKKYNLNEIAGLLEIFSKLIPLELQLNELVLSSYGIKGSTLFSSMIYPY
ncbi:MAG: Eco57I restriction-modification methylase domain-containing protein [Candidatus Hodarchaeales archaeon]|jgi:hypothetical protein